MYLKIKIFYFFFRAVTDPRDGRRVALKKLPNVFQSLVSSKRVFRELKMLCFFKHENVSILKPILIIVRYINPSISLRQSKIKSVLNQHSKMVWFFGCKKQNFFSGSFCIRYTPTSSSRLLPRNVSFFINAI